MSMIGIDQQWIERIDLTVWVRNSSGTVQEQSKNSSRTVQESGAEEEERTTGLERDTG